MAVESKRAAKRALAAGALLLALRPALSAGGGTVPIVVLKEHGVGNQALAQPYLDRMVALAAKQNGWAGVNGKYFTKRAAAEVFIKAETPHYGILSLSAFLALRRAHQLDVIGKVEVSLAGGRRYYLISETADDLTGCKGRRLATDHADDVRFIDTVVLGGEANLADFTLVPTRRPLQTIRAVLTAEAVCALIDDAQKAQLDHLRSKDGVRTVWEGAELPPMPVVAFPAAPEAERTAFKKKLDGVCEDDGKMACVEVGIDDLSGADAGDYATVVVAYGE
ncbi:MAG: hypothetical protein ACREVY_09340 [Gammaproteobacteria bacterium]